MFRLASALADRGWRVVCTTTTHLGREESSLAPHHLWSQDAPLSARELLAELETARHLLVTGPRIEGGERWAGVSPDWVAQTASLAPVDAILVEADGARDLPFKAPALHEPVVPPATTLLIPVVGVDAVGRAIADGAHRPEQVAALLGVRPADRLTPEAIASVLVHPAGGLKARPADARVRVLINKVETQSDMISAREIAQYLLYKDGRGGICKALTPGEQVSEGEPVSAVVIGAMQSRSPVREVRRRVAAVVLAAGRSTRMAGDSPKQLLPWNDTTVIGQVVETLSCCRLSPLLLVLGHRAKEIRQALAGTRAQFVDNPDYAEGEMLSSLQTGVRALNETVSGCLVLLADQPWLEAGLVERLLDAYAAGPSGIIAPAYQGKRGHPVLIDRRHWAEMLALGQNLAPRHLLQRHPADICLVPVETDSILDDMDTTEAYHRAKEERGRHHR